MALICLDNLLTDGLSASCERVVGGIAEMWVLENGLVEDFTVTDGEISALTTTDDALFHQFIFNTSQNTAFYEQNVTVTVESQVALVGVVISAQFRGVNKTNREILNQLLDLRELAVIIKDSNDNYLAFGLGKDGVHITDTTFNSGATRSDFSGVELTLGREDAINFAYPVDPEIIAGLTVPTP